MALSALEQNKSTTHEALLRDAIEQAKKVVAPLWPITTFAARSPWLDLESMTFEETARFLQKRAGVSIYPQKALLRQAVKEHKIDQKLVERRLQRWIKEHSFALDPREVAAFCQHQMALDASKPRDLAIAKSQELEAIFAHIDSPSTTTKSTWLEENTQQALATKVDLALIKWTKLYTNRSQDGWMMPGVNKGFFLAWRNAIAYDPMLTKQERKRSASVPKDAIGALAFSLDALGVCESEQQAYLEAHLLRLPGYAGMLRYLDQTNHTSLLVAFLAIAVTLEWLFIEPYLPIASTQTSKETLRQALQAWSPWFDATEATWLSMPKELRFERFRLAHAFSDLTSHQIWLEAWEETELLHFKTSWQKRTPVLKIKKPPIAQWLFCIDVRSEPIRRALEQTGDFETFGAAGFFGLPIAIKKADSERVHPALPVLLAPKHHIEEQLDPDDKTSYEEKKHAHHALSHAFHLLKQSTLGSLLLPEATGPLLGLQMVLQSILPTQTERTQRSWLSKWFHKPATTFTLTANKQAEKAPSSALTIGFTLEEKVNYVAQQLRLIGLTQHFAPFVILCGHESHSTNNPYAAKLECGACGGASGEANASIFAAIANEADVRNKLASEGIIIPEETIFVAAKQITSIDKIEWVNKPTLTETQKAHFTTIDQALHEIREPLNHARMANLPHLDRSITRPTQTAQRMAHDWSEVRPEWGLAKNSAMIIGKRAISETMDLQGRVFLHSYDWHQDHDGALLAGILAGPATVAQWINLQYYASTVAPHYYGSGQKALQTVTSGLGVMQGNASDLLTGLPWQSVMQSDETFYHDPIRLLLIIEAPRELVLKVLEENPTFRQKIENHWLRLAIIDPHHGFSTLSDKIASHNACGE
nr:DUF2309 domain-containing protein [Bacilli bacterium]